MTDVTTLNINELANLYCMLVAEWGFKYHPERMPYLYSQKPYDYPPETSITGEVHRGFREKVYPGDLCDDNMAMDAALKHLGVDTDKFVDFLPEWVVDSWNAAWFTAKANRFMPVAGRSGPLYLCVWYEGYGDAGAEVVGPDYFSEEMGFRQDDQESIRALRYGQVHIVGGVCDEMAVIYLGDDIDRRPV